MSANPHLAFPVARAGPAGRRRERYGHKVELLVWIDCEMTGLDPTRDLLLEVACVVTDGDLNQLGDGIDLVISAPEQALLEMDPVVIKMHKESGLDKAVLASTLSLEDAESQVLDFIRQYVPEPRKAPLCGNSIGTDRAFIARYMPDLDAYLHYRMVDVSSVKELARRWYPRAYYASPAKRGGHRALADITESVQELRYYREAIFVPQPGPSSEEARAIAAKIGGEEAAPPPEAASSA
jgi:oligoribonuclease